MIEDCYKVLNFLYLTTLMNLFIPNAILELEELTGNTIVFNYIDEFVSLLRNIGTGGAHR